MKQYVKYAKPYLSSFIIGPILMIVEVIGEVLMPWLFSVIINYGINTKDQVVTGKGTGFIITIGILMVFTALIMMLGGIGGAYFATKASTNFANDLRKDMYKKIQGFSFNNIDTFTTSSLITRLTNDVTQIQNIINMGLRMMLRAPGMLIGALIMSFIINAKLALIILIVIPILVISITTIVSKAFPRFQIMQKQLDKVNSSIQESLTNIRVVKSFVRGNFEEQKFSYENKSLRDKGLNASKIMILTMPIATLAMNITTVAIVWFGGNQVITGNMATGDLTAFTTYVVQILMSLMMVSMVILNSSRALASSERILKVLNTEIDLTDDSAKQKQLLINEGLIEFKHVYFRYYKNNIEWVLEDINFKAYKGQVIGIIGSTGCGKTTMVSLLPRLYDADMGEILVDGVNVKDYSLKNLRNGIAMVLQNNVLFSGTIKDNLLWGDESAKDDELYKTAESAKAHDFITSFTKGYETELGQGGINVSGGQKQRLCIARALLKKPKILILDDSTSAVDTATEARIRASFSTTLKDTTKFIIAQRISSVIDADMIIVMNEGKIADMGTHEILLKSCREYQEIYNSQMDKEGWEVAN